MSKIYKIRIIFFLSLVLLVAGFLRLYQLDKIPPGLYPDEAMYANNAFTSPGHVFYADNNGREGLFINIVSLSFKVLGVSPFSLRLVSAIIGILTVFGLFLLSREIFSSISDKKETVNYLALLASFFIAVSFWHINFSRIGFRAITLPFILVFIFYFLMRGLRKKNTILMIIAGALFGLGFYTYSSFRLSFLILPLTLLPYWILSRKEKQQKQFIISFITFGLAACIIVIPLVLYFIGHQADFFGRLGDVSIFSQPNIFKAFFESLGRHLIMFNAVGDWNWRHNLSGAPELSLIVGIFFLIGFGVAIKKLFLSIKAKNYQSQSAYWLIFSWFCAMILPGVLTYEGLPHSLRTIGLIPVVFIFAAIGAHWLFERIKRIKRIPPLNSEKKWRMYFIYIIASLLFLGLFVGETQKYFVDWAQNSEIKGAFAVNFVKIGEAINGLSSEQDIYVIVNEPGTAVPYPDGVSVSAQTIMFIERMEYGKLRAKYLKPDQFSEIKIGDKKIVIIPMRFDDDILNNLKNTFPSGIVKIKNNIKVFLIN